MSSAKVIAVVGATGKQGGSVVNTFLSEAGWRVRALTRDISSSKARDLATRGAEIVRADMDDPLTLVTAFHGAHAIFAVSNFWTLYSDMARRHESNLEQPLTVSAGLQETRQLNNVIDAAAKVSTLERFVLSSLSNATKWSQGQYTHVYHFDSKANAEDYAKTKYPNLWAKTSIFQAGFFLSGFVTNPIMQPTKNEYETVQFISSLDPDQKQPFIAGEEDCGPITRALVKEQAGKKLIGYREWLTLRELASAFTQATGLTAEVVHLPKGQFRFDPPPDLKMLLYENWAYINEFGYCGKDDDTIIHPKELASPLELDTVLNYMKKQDWASVLGSKR